VFGGYRVEQLIGRGGMGAVLRATRLSDGEQVALKLVLGERAADRVFQSRFEREGRLASSFDHPHLVRVLEVGTHEGTPFMAMAFVDGVDLEGVLASSGTLHPVTAAKLVAQIGDGLDALHAADLVHRDVKPGNVLLESRPGGVHALLSDFGLSKHVDSMSGLTKTGQWVGTVDYAAPEQVQAEDTGPFTDVYALGCVLYESLTGDVPFPRAREVDKLMAHVIGPPPVVTERAPDLPEAFDEVVEIAMATHPDDRYESAGELGQAALAAAAEAGPEPDDPVPFPTTERVVDSDAPTAG
jgi:serine/threonine-protein kinase